MKFSRDQFKEIVREVMKEELPRLIEKTLTEQYLKGLLRESAQPASRSKLSRSSSKLAEMLAGDPHDPEHDEVPEALGNDDEGIYDVPKVGPKDTASRKKVQESLRRKVMADLPPDLFEGTGPLPSDESGAPDVPIEALALDPRKFRKMFASQNEVPSYSSSDKDKILAMKEDELRRKREALEVRVPVTR